MTEPNKQQTTTAKRKRAPRKKAPAKRRDRITAEVRHQMIAEAAYLKAESRGFTSGDPESDWHEAEAEVDALLLGANSPKS